MVAEQVVGEREVVDQHARDAAGERAEARGVAHGITHHEERRVCSHALGPRRVALGDGHERALTQPKLLALRVFVHRCGPGLGQRLAVGQGARALFHARLHAGGQHVECVVEGLHALEHTCFPGLCAALRLLRPHAGAFAQLTVQLCEQRLHLTAERLLDTTGALRDARLLAQPLDAGGGARQPGRELRVWRPGGDLGGGLLGGFGRLGALVRSERVLADPLIGDQVDEEAQQEPRELQHEA